MRGSIRKRSTDPSYEIRVFVGTDAAGKKRHVNETVRGTKADAERRLAMLLLEHGDGQVLADYPGTNLAVYTAQDLRLIEYRINSMPRRSLNWSTAETIYTAAVAMTD